MAQGTARYSPLEWHALHLSSLQSEEKCGIGKAACRTLMARTRLETWQSSLRSLSRLVTQTRARTRTRTRTRTTHTRTRTRTRPHLPTHSSGPCRLSTRARSHTHAYEHARAHTRQQSGPRACACARVRVCARARVRAQLRVHLVREFVCPLSVSVFVRSILARCTVRKAWGSSVRK